MIVSTMTGDYEVEHCLVVEVFNLLKINRIRYFLEIVGEEMRVLGWRCD